MGLEAASFIANLNANWPEGATDPKSQGDDHIKMIKAVLQATFPGRYSAEFTRVNYGTGASAAVTDNCKVWLATNAGLTFTIAPATVGANFVLFVRNMSSGNLIISNGVATVAIIIAGGSAMILSDSAVLYTFHMPSPYQILSHKAVFDGSLVGTNAPLGGFGFTNCVRNGVGDYTFNLSVAMPVVTYVPLVCASRSTANAAITCNINQSRSFDASAFSVICTDMANTVRDAYRLYVSISGE